MNVNLKTKDGITIPASSKERSAMNGFTFKQEQLATKK